MRSVLGQAQESAPTVQTIPRNGPPPTLKEIPYDYVATFTLQGKRGNRVQDVINISTDGAFVAVSIGYSFIPELTKHLTIDIPPLSSPPPIPLTTGKGLGVRLTGVGLLPQVLPDFGGFSQDFALFLLSSTQLDPNISPILNPIALMECLLIQTCGLDFKYSIIDSGSGRELQNQPIHNIAGLGKADGERPFRPLAKPMLFMPRSTIRIEVEEVSAGLLYQDSLLFIVLHGYKILGYGTGLP
jgi:hypothetical protein